MKRTTRNAEKTKQIIIEKSAPIFNINGYAGTKMQMLVDATGYQMGGIYRHFNNKMDLAKAAFQYNYEVLIKPSITIDPNQNPKEQLLSIITNYKKMVIRPRIKGGCPILNTAIEVDDTNTEFTALTRIFLNDVLVTLEGVLTEGKNLGVFNPSIDPQKEALYFLATFEGAVMIGNLTKSSTAIFDIFNKMVEYIEDKIFVD